MMHAPLRFQPHLRPMVWGGRRLAEVLGKRLPTDEPYGETWEISDHASHRSTVSSGHLAGQTLHSLMDQDPEALFGSAVARSRQEEPFPWLIKFLDANDWLSVQVHPDEISVKTLWPGEGSKTEAWFILAAEPGSKVYAGLQPGVGERELRKALAQGTVAECLHSFDPRPGDCLFLRAGTVHAVGGGVLIAEVQQTSDATFRLFDWNRVDARGQSRTLHIEQAMACIDWQAGPVQPTRALGFPQSPRDMASIEPVRQRLVRCPYFHLEYLRQVRPFPCGGSNLLQAMLILHGRGSFRTPEGLQLLGPGDTLLLPAAMPEVWCHPEGPLGVMLVTLPPQGYSSSKALVA